MIKHALPVVSPAFLGRLIENHGLCRETWYLVASSTLAVLNRPQDVQVVYTYALANLETGHERPATREEKLRVSRRVREALVKTSVIAGLPKSINALMSLKMVTPSELLDGQEIFSPTSRRGDLSAPSARILDRGQAFFDALYGKLSRRIMRQMYHSGTEDLGL
ncbi:hypothetical protein Micbo1qcDRAFT_160670, partial [Microdochium bolleyi]